MDTPPGPPGAVMRRAAAGPLASLRAAALPWAVAHVLVLAALALAHYLVSHTHPSDPMVAVRAHEGLKGWDAGYYVDIATKGYAALPRSALRFFPLLPILGRGLHDIIRLPAGTCVVVVANACALAAGALLYTLAVTETGDAAAGRRAAWLLALAPSAFVLVMGYAEALMLVCAIAAFLAMRSGRWWWAAAAAYLAGLSRPLGVLLAAAVAVELWTGRRRPEARRALVAKGVALVAAPAGAATFMAWVAGRFGDFLLPWREQQQPNLRGRFADPVTTIVNDAKGTLHGHVGTGLHVPWLALFVVLVVVAFRVLPASYGTFAAVVIASAVSSSNLDSIERYALSAFPLVLAGALLTSGSRVERTVLTLFAGGLVGYALLAFLNALVP